MSNHSGSLLVRICDFLAASSPSLGRLFGCAPSHHIVMENTLYGRSQPRERRVPDWGTWDLKPTSYFYPERDIAGGALTSEATKGQLVGEFHDKIVLSQEQADDFFRILEEDTQFLAEHNAVDYSLFLVRKKVSGQASQDVSQVQDTSVAPATWRRGILSADGWHMFRASILDFFWAKHKPQPQAMTLLIRLWNLLISRSEPMSITTSPSEYRERFLKMCRSIVEIRQQDN